MNQSNYENAIEVIGQAVFELLPPEDSYNDNGRDNVQSLLNCCEDGYCLIQWLIAKNIWKKIGLKKRLYWL